MVSKNDFTDCERYFDLPEILAEYDGHVHRSVVVGRDGTTQSQFAKNIRREIELISSKFTASTYDFTSYKEKLISKGAGRPPRVICIPTIRDRLTLRILNKILSDAFPLARTVLPHVYIKNIKGCLNASAKPSDQSFVRLDVRDYFPSIGHKRLLEKVRRVVKDERVLYLIYKALKTTTGSSKAEKGVPQGLSISNILSGIYLSDLDKRFKSRYKYFRYVDDVLVICESAEAQLIFAELRKAFSGLGLRCHPLGPGSKSQVCSVEKGVDYLGFHLCENSISVRESSYRRMMENILSVLTSHKHGRNHYKAESSLVFRLNLKITGCIFEYKRYGWMFFFSQMDDVAQLARLDKFVREELRARGLRHLEGEIKRFTRSYHEIRKNLTDTTYVPKFDEMGISHKAKVLAEANGVFVDEYAAKLSEVEIEARFRDLIHIETKGLERDLIEVIS